MKKYSLFSCLVFVFLVVMAQQKHPSLKAAMERGKKVFDQNCLTCHQPDGNGVPMLNPPLAKTSYVLGDKKKLITVVLKGMNDPGDIDGMSYSNVMAPHNFLSDQQIADVLTFIRHSFGNKASMVTAGEVKAVRAKTKGLPAVPPSAKKN